MRAALAALAIFAGLPAHAQASDIPRTPEGRPDFHGLWLSGFTTTLERLDGVDGLIVPEANEAAVLAKFKDWFDEGEVYDPETDSNPLPLALLTMNGQMRSSQIVEPADGKLPLTSLARAAIDRMKGGYDNPEERPPTERCVDGMASAPIGSSTLIIPLLIVQTPQAAVLVMEDADQARIALLSDQAPPATMRTRQGVSRGRWEGDTLVIETDRIAVTSGTGIISRAGAPITADSRVVERFSLQGPDAILYQFTVEDPSLFTAPWRAEYVMKRHPGSFHEYACHEGNYAIVNILQAARLGRQSERATEEEKAEAAN